MINNEIKIEFLTNDQDSIKEIAKLHKQLFDKDHFTSTFSEDLLSDYFTALLNKSHFKYKAIVDNEIVGYLIAGVNLDKVLSDFSRKNLLKLFYYLIRNPRFVKEKIQDLFRKIFFSNLKSSAEMRLFLIAAKRGENIKGVGKKLIQQLEQDLLQIDISVYGLSVRKHNSKAIDFYLKQGFIEEFRTGKSIYFIKSL